MEIEVKAWLYDVLNAIIEIEGFFAANNINFPEYQDNIMFRRAVERNLEIIGEAVNRVLKSEPNIKITNARRIVLTRNQIIHQYEFVSDEVIWDIIKNHLPLLKQEIQTLIP